MASSNNATTTNSAHVKALIQYIGDVKPFHTKLREIVEEYSFSDSLTVKMEDSHTMEIEASSLWNKSVISDGARRTFAIPMVVAPKALRDSEGSLAPLVSDNIIPGLEGQLFSYRNMAGREDGHAIPLVLGAAQLHEGLDYHISYGSHCINTLPGARWQQLELTSIPRYHTHPGIPIYADVTLTGLAVKNITSTALGAGEEWTLECIGPATYAVRGTTSGFLGLATENSTFTHALVSFDITGDSTFATGESIKLTPGQRVVVNPNAPHETWSLIKTNPQQLERAPRFRSGTGPTLEIMTLSPEATQQTWTITYNGTQYAVVGSVSGLIGYAPGPIAGASTSAPFIYNDFIFKIHNGLRPPVVSEYFELVIKNPPLTSSDVSRVTAGGYDSSEYDDEPYEFYDLVFEPTVINLVLTEPTLANNTYFELVALSPTTMSVTQYTNDTDDRQVVSTFSNLTIDVPYTCPSFTCTVTSTVRPFVEGEQLQFTASNPPAYIDSILFNRIVSPTAAWFSVYMVSTFETPASFWTIDFSSSTNYRVIGYDTLGGILSGYPKYGSLSDGKSYRDSLIHFTIHQNDATFTVGDTFEFSLTGDRSTYLVHGSVSGWQKSAVVGEWYWNGKIGFKIPTPLTRLNTDGLVAGDGTVDVTYIRRDVQQTQYVLEFINQNRALIRTETEYVGGAVVGQPWESEQIKFTIVAGSTPFANGDKIVIDVIERKVSTWAYVPDPFADDQSSNAFIGFIPEDLSNPLFGLTCGHHAVVVPNNTATTLRIDKMLKDEVSLKLDGAADYPELGAESDYVPLVFEYYDGTTRAHFSDLTTKIVAKLAANTNQTVFVVNCPANGTKQRPLYSAITFDSLFFSTYMAMGKKYDIIVSQNQTMGDKMVVSMTDMLTVADVLRMNFGDTLTAVFDDAITSAMIASKLEVADFITVSMVERGAITRPVQGYDLLGFDEKPYDSIILVEEGNSVAPMGFYIDEKPSDSLGPQLTDALTVYEFVMINGARAGAKIHITAPLADIPIEVDSLLNTTNMQPYPVQSYTIHHNFTSTPTVIVQLPNGDYDSPSFTVLNNKSLTFPGYSGITKITLTLS